MNHVSVFGGGPAGASAAIAACRRGSQVTIYERGIFPRHKVCGEFFSPEIAALLEDLGLWSRFESLHPHRYTRLELNFGKRVVRDRFAEPAFGLSRHAFDKLLLDHARELGAAIVRTAPGDDAARPAVIAHGRRDEIPRGARFFGFKAHFTGPADDTVSLYFGERCYIGVNSVEGGVTNVCGIGPEFELRQAGFDFDAYIARIPAAYERLKPLTRQFDWLATGPLAFRQHWGSHEHGRYLAGDALSFIDPFTGTGMLSAVLTGKWAGEHAAAGIPVEHYMRLCRQSLRGAFLASSLFRAVWNRGCANVLAPLFPGRLLMRLTRPNV